MRRPEILFMALVLTGVLPAAARSGPAQESPVGQVIDCAGTVEVRPAHQPVRKPSLLMPLRKGDVLAVKTGGSIQVVFYKGGVRQALSGGSTARVDQASLVAVAGPAPTSLRPLSVPAAGMQPEGGRVMTLVTRGGGADRGLGPRMPSPVGPIHAGPVTLRWQGPIEGTEIEVRVRVAGENGRTVIVKTLASTAREMVLAEGTLKPGELYVWTAHAFTASGDSSHDCSSPFRIGLSGEDDTLVALESDVTEKLVDAGAWLVLAEFRETIARFPESLDAYRQALKLRPGDARIAHAIERLEKALGVTADTVNTTR